MKVTRIAWMFLAGLLSVTPVCAQDVAPGPEPVAEVPETVILDEFGSWRMFAELKAPEIAFDDGVQIVKYVDPEDYWLNGDTPQPPTNWTSPEFKDSEWLRGPIGIASHSAFTTRACFRGKFRVTDTNRVKPLKLEVAYHGGVIVCLNGQEVGRKNIKADARLAEVYPQGAFNDPPADRNKQVDPAAQKAVDVLRERTLKIALPPQLLRNGVNVLSLEVIRSPYDKILDEHKKINWNKEPMYIMSWNTCELLRVNLTTTAPDGIEANSSRPDGLQLWNSSLLRTDFVMDRGDPCEDLQPIRISAVRNGIYSGKVVVGSGKAIRGLKAVPGELKGNGGVIPVSALRVRYGVPGGAEYGVEATAYGASAPQAPRRAERAQALSVLEDKAPAECTVVGSGRTAGATAPIWLTVKVPTSARPGTYTGKLTVSCEGEKTTQVPVELTVLDWTLPDPDKFQTWTEVMQSPDTLQLEYQVPAWSDKHFELIGRSFRLMSEVGSKVVYVPLICCTNLGNEESMVRWIDKGDGNYDFDFTVMDRYLDVAQKNLGQPEIVCFIVWEVFMLPSKDLSVGGAHSDIPKDISRFKDRMRAPNVTMNTLDPETGKPTRTAFNNYFTDENNKRQWKKLFDQLHARMKKRGLEDAMMLGWFTDVRAQKDEFTYWREVSGDLPWVSHAHWRLSTRGGGIIKTGYHTSIHDIQRPVDPAKGRKYGWKKTPIIWAQQLLRPGWRGEMDMLPGSMWSSMTEITLTGGQRGFGRLGGDSWYVVKDKRGRRTGRAYERYPWSTWSNLELCCSLFAPGPDGAVTTAHFEQLREGVQQSEARIFIEQTLTDPDKKTRIGQELAEECQTTLDERLLFDLRGVANYTMWVHAYSSPFMWWFQNGVAGHAWKQSTNWRERDEKLYTLAGEVARKLGNSGADR